MIQKKICMLGAFAVGKTSLIARFLDNSFSDRYLTTAGVKIGKKILDVDGQQVSLILWDLAGEDEFQRVQTTYFRGAAGYLLVIDGTRRETFATGLILQERIESELGPSPFVVVVNKNDLRAEWAVSDADLQSLRDRGWTVLFTSAKTGDGVLETFTELAGRTLQGTKGAM